MVIGIITTVTLLIGRSLIMRTIEKRISIIKTTLENIVNHSNQQTRNASKSIVSNQHAKKGSTKVETRARMMSNSSTKPVVNRLRDNAHHNSNGSVNRRR